MHVYVKAAIVAAVVVYMANRTDMIGGLLGPQKLQPVK